MRRLTRRQAVILALAALALLAAVLGLWTCRERGSIAAARRETAEIRRKQAALARYIERHGSLDEHRELLLDEDALLSRCCPQSLDAQRVTGELNDAALGARLRITQLTWSQPKPALPKTPKVACQRYEIEVQAAGDYFAWRDFCRAVEHESLLVLTSKVELGANAGTGELNGRVTLATFAQQ